MSDSQQPHAAPLHPDPEIAASLEFEPVPRKLERAGGWNAEAQRAFIAALALTGSARRAAQAVGMRTAGVERLRETRGGESFAAAWDRAIEVAAAARTGRLRDTLERLHSSPERGGGPLRADGAVEGPVHREPIPVICDSCRAEGAAGGEAFSAIPDILAFDPVPRPPHDRLWDEPTQRAFIAALAVTGSPARAARSVGRHAFGAEKLRKARGARSFNEAWEAAMDLARERELSRLHGKLSDLSNPPSPSMGEGAQASGPSPRWSGPCAGEGEFEGADPQVLNEFGQYEDAASFERRAEEARERIFVKLQRLRRNMLRDEIIPFPEKRAAWVVLNGSEEIEALTQDVRGTSEEAHVEGGSADSNALSPSAGEGAQGSGPSPGWSGPCAGEGAKGPTSSSPAPTGDPARHSRARGNPAENERAPPSPSRKRQRKPGPGIRRVWSE